MRFLKSKTAAVGLVAGMLIAILSTALWAAAPTTVDYRPIPTSLIQKDISITGTSGTIITADATNKIQVWSIEWNTSSSTTVEFLSGTRSFTNAQSLLCDRIPPPSGRPGVDCAVPWKETSAAEAFNVNFGASTTMTGSVFYTVLP
jgi:hypothetical protein